MVKIRKISVEMAFMNKMLKTIIIFLFFVTSLSTFTLTVQDKNGNPVSGFKWLLEEDTTHWVNSGVLASGSIGVNIHNSYNPVVDKGHSNLSTAVINVPSSLYYLILVIL